jgi:hypothetical protein
VASSALAGLYKLFGDDRYKRRAEQWLAEGVDIDADGQYTERSTIGYNGICNRSLVLIAEWLEKPEYLEPVRRNLDASLYLLHPDGEVVTEISRRQDLNQRGTLFNHWFPLMYMAWKDRNGMYAALARQFLEPYASLSWLLAWPQLFNNLPAGTPLPDNYERMFPSIGLARIRRGPMSVSILRGTDRFLTYRHDSAVIQAVRFASAFFGKGQFVGESMEKQGRSYLLKQKLEAGYYQPFTPPRKITTETYDATREQRRRTEICELTCTAAIMETGNGIELTVTAAGTDEVPLTVEINLSEGSQVEGAEKLGKLRDAWLLRAGKALVRRGNQTIAISPGLAKHHYFDVRGALPRLEGPSLFLTGFTPFEHKIRIETV